MLNNRMLAVAAVLALAVPALGAAAPIVVPPQAEQLVEGHTVFTVIQIANATTTNETRFAAAVAVLVREYTAQNNNVRFPGVLWFNDQYLVNPQSAERAAAAYRYPCGGAVLAVNQGDPDPRVLIANAGANVDGTQYGQDPAAAPTDFAWIGAQGTVDTTTPTASGNVWSDTITGSAGDSLEPTFGMNYVESYLITDPNDHMWIIDMYMAYHRTGTLGVNDQVYFFPVWAVNMHGGPAFIPDDGVSNCSPFYDVAVSLVPGYDGHADTVNGELSGAGAPDGVKLPASCGNSGPGTARDNPCMGYAEPSRNKARAPADTLYGYCYGGQAEKQAGETAPNCDRTRKPLRLYNAVLYFNLEDLTESDGTVVNHGANSDHTNGCQVGTEWTCPGYDGADPGTGDDNAEGNSHPFHPRTHAGHVDEQPCPPEFGGNNPTNHGGSGSITPTTPHTDGAYAGTPCGYDHATRNIDVYFSGQGRPFIPLVRFWAEQDFEGSTAPFHDYPAAYGSP